MPRTDSTQPRRVLPWCEQTRCRGLWKEFGRDTSARHLLLILLVAHLMNPLFLFFAVPSPSCLSMVGLFFPFSFCPLATRGQGLAQKVEIEPRSNHLRANHHFFFGMMHGFGRVRTRYAARFWLSGNKAPLPISPDLDSPRDIRSSCRSPSQHITGSGTSPWQAFICAAALRSKHRSNRRPILRPTVLGPRFVSSPPRNRPRTNQGRCLCT